MTTEAKENLLSWLRDAYAMENQALEQCERMSESIHNYPDLKQRIFQHAQETKQQIEKLDRCFKILNEDPSSFKNAVGWTMGNMHAMGTMLADDQVIKGSLISYAFEHMEIASYSVLIAAAEACGYPEIARLCSENMEQEQAMANFLKEHLPETVHKFLHLDETDGQRAAA